MCPSVTAQLVAQGVNTVIYASKLSLTPCYYLFEIQPPGSLNSLRYQLLVPVPTPCKHVVLFAILFLCNYESCCLFPTLPTLGSYQIPKALKWHPRRFLAALQNGGIYYSGYLHYRSNCSIICNCLYHLFAYKSPTE